MTQRMTKVMHGHCGPVRVARAMGGPLRLAIALIVLGALAWRGVCAAAGGGDPTGATAAERIPVIVDTDVALDDVRAIALLAADRRIDLRAIVTSDGSSGPDVGAKNIGRVLAFLGLDDVQVGAGDTRDLPAPSWRTMVEALGGAKLDDAGPRTTAFAPSLIAKTLRIEGPRTTYVCLGPLTNLAAALERGPELADRIEVVYYWGTPPWATELSWNTERDTTAARIVFESQVAIYAIHLDGPQQIIFDRELYNEIRKLPSRSAALIAELHRAPQSRAFLDRGHFRALDETVALCLLDPEVIELAPLGDHPLTYEISKWNQLIARRAYVEMLKGAAQ